ncbi:MAG TPA: hypothetical protein VGP96_15080, partial [Candidatus Dormibacteraeota bacterium]|nr:hypothetical protein [Candidatus Dormibacteraeota bacterium]
MVAEVAPPVPPAPPAPTETVFGHDPTVVLTYGTLLLAIVTLGVFIATLVLAWYSARPARAVITSVAIQREEHELAEREYRLRVARARPLLKAVWAGVVDVRDRTSFGGEVRYVGGGDPAHDVQVIVRRKSSGMSRSKTSSPSTPGPTSSRASSPKTSRQRPLPRRSTCLTTTWQSPRRRVPP